VAQERKLHVSPGSIKAKKFLLYVGDYQVLKKGPAPQSYLISFIYFSDYLITS
jgi:hypothetical protein